MFRERRDRRWKVEKAAVEGTNQWGRTEQSVQEVTSGYTKKPAKPILGEGRAAKNWLFASLTVPAWGRYQLKLIGAKLKTMKKGAAETPWQRALQMIYCGFKGRMDIFSQRGVPQWPHLAMKSHKGEGWESTKYHTHFSCSDSSLGLHPWTSLGTALWARGTLSQALHHQCYLLKALKSILQWTFNIFMD